MTVGDSFTAVGIKSSDNGCFMIAKDIPDVPWRIKHARVWDLNTGKPVSQPLPFDRDYGLSSDGKVAFTTDDEHIRVWNVKTSKEIWATDFHRPVGVSISPNGNEIVAISEIDTTVQVWRIGTAQSKLSIKQSDTSLVVDFDPTGMKIASGGERLDIYDALTGSQLVRDIYFESDWNIRRQFSSTGKRFLELHDGIAQVIDATTGKMLLRIKSGHVVGSIHWSADSDKILFWLPEEMKAQIYDATTGMLDRTVDGHQINDLQNLWILTGGRWAIIERVGKPLEVMDLTTGRVVQTLLNCKYCVCEPLGKILITQDANKVTTLWRLQTLLK